MSCSIFTKCNIYSGENSRKFTFTRIIIQPNLLKPTQFSNIYSRAVCWQIAPQPQVTVSILIITPHLCKGGGEMRDKFWISLPAIATLMTLRLYSSSCFSHYFCLCIKLSAVSNARKLNINWDAWHKFGVYSWHLGRQEIHSNLKCYLHIFHFFWFIWDL